MLNLCSIVEIFRCQEIMMSQIDSWHRNISTGRHFQNGPHNTAQIQHCPISTTFHMWVDYDVPKWFLTSKNFYNTAQIQHCSISKVAFNLFFKPVVSARFGRLRYRWMFNFCGIVACIFKIVIGRNFSMSGINIYPHIKLWWYRTMFNFCGIVAAILKIVIGRNFSMSGINWGHHYLPTYQILMISVMIET
jgi:hypothetical protein